MYNRINIKEKEVITVDVIIRKENSDEYGIVNDVIKSAFFKENKISDFNEWNLVSDIRNSPYYINELSLVAEYDNKIVGHIMYTPMSIINDGNINESLALAPLSVHKDYQNKGIGSKLMTESIKKAKSLGYTSIIVLGHPKLYKKFGFIEALNYNIGLDEECNNPYLFALELEKDSLSNVKGIVKYCDPFYSDGELI
ncbi:N-acetyltransferase [Vallitalea longa]|uniref:N-acetyltransferase n=1 Tax=Vallitalea longa TaxID=2936439 RepID=A0A9W5YA83_9FIRM|nr:N-acetyltransferase [Vallitalea longa]